MIVKGFLGKIHEYCIAAEQTTFITAYSVNPDETLFCDVSPESIVFANDPNCYKLLTVFILFFKDFYKVVL